MKTITKDQQIKNCLLALSIWAEVPPRRVKLDSWKCGTHACFGGHMATWPEFQAKGVFPDERDGAPRMMGEDGLNVGTWTVAQHLFGNHELFRVRFGIDPKRLSDHELVVRRLEDQIVELSQ